MMWPQLPDYGCLARWPQDGSGFIHPADVQTVRRLFPSKRVFRRDTFDGEFYLCSYGELSFRLRPCLWLPVRNDGLDIGDRVETTGVGMVHDLFVGTIISMHFVRREDCIMYGLQRGNMLHTHPYRASSLRLLADKIRIRPVEIAHRNPDPTVGSYSLQDSDA